MLGYVIRNSKALRDTYKSYELCFCVSKLKSSRYLRLKLKLSMWLQHFIKMWSLTGVRLLQPTASYITLSYVFCSANGNKLHYYHPHHHH